MVTQGLRFCGNNRMLSAELLWRYIPTSSVKAFLIAVRCRFVAGYLELGETVEEGAVREAREELNVDIHVGQLLALYSLPHIGQMYNIAL